jgi:hypothetical protein
MMGNPGAPMHRNPDTGEWEPYAGPPPLPMHRNPDTGGWDPMRAEQAARVRAALGNRDRPDELVGPGGPGGPAHVGGGIGSNVFQGGPQAGTLRPGVGPAAGMGGMGGAGPGSFGSNVAQVGPQAGTLRPGVQPSATGPGGMFGGGMPPPPQVASLPPPILPGADREGGAVPLPPPIPPGAGREAAPGQAGGFDPRMMGLLGIGLGMMDRGRNGGGQGGLLGAVGGPQGLLQLAQLSRRD